MEELIRSVRLVKYKLEQAQVRLINCSAIALGLRPELNLSIQWSRQERKLAEADKLLSQLHAQWFDRSLFRDRQRPPVHEQYRALPSECLTFMNILMRDNDVVGVLEHIRGWLLNDAVLSAEAIMPADILKRQTVLAKTWSYLTIFLVTLEAMLEVKTLRESVAAEG